MPTDITWAERVRNLNHALGRPATLDELLAVAEIHTLTPAEMEEQRQSWVRAFAPCEHGVRDWEQCPDCRRDARDE